MKNEIIYIVRHKESDFTEGFIKKEIDFKDWLLKHNKRRTEEESLLEDESQFELIRVCAI